MRWARSSLRRLRDAPAAAFGSAILVLVTAFVFAAGPRVLDALADRAVRDEISAAPPSSANLQLTEIRRIEPGTGEPLDSVLAQGDGLAARLPSTVQGLIVDRRYVVDTTRFSVLAKLAERDTVTMRFQQGVADRVAYDAGRAPTGATREIAAKTLAGFESLEPDTPITEFEAAMSADTAKLLGVHAGDVLPLWLDGSDALAGTAAYAGAPCAVVLVGVFHALDQADPVWYGEEGLLRASIRVYGPSLAINDARVLMAPEAYVPVMHLTASVPVVLRYQWRYLIDPDRISARDLGNVIAALQQTETTYPKSSTVARQANTAQLTSALADLLDGFRNRWSFATTVMAAGAIGPAAMAIGALGLIALLSARGRRAALGRWRTRGASTLQVLRGTFSEGILVGVPAALAGIGLALAIVGDGPPGAALAAGGVVLAAGVILVGILEIPPSLVPKAGGGADRDETLGARVAVTRPDRRAIMAELTIAVLAVAAIVLLRTRGSGAVLDRSADASATANPLLVAAPALGGIAAALLARRVIPVAIRAASRVTARRRDLAATLAMRRAGREGGPGAMLMTLLATTAITVFSAATVLSLDHGADLVAWQQVGADYRISTGFRQLPAGIDASTLPGSTGLATAYRGAASIGSDLTSNELLVLDAPAFAAVDRGTPADPQLPAEMLVARPVTLPVIVSTLTAARAQLDSVGDAFVLRIHSDRFDAHVAAIRDDFPSLATHGSFVVVSAGQVTALHPALSLPPTDAFVSAPDSAHDALAATLTRLGPSVRLDSRADVATSLRDRPVNRAVATVVLAAAAIAAAYAVLALVASLALAGAARSIEVAHLRMLGLARGEATALLAFEYGPVLGLAMLVGAIVGLALFAVLGSALGLGVLLGSPLEIPLAIEPGPLALVIGATLALLVLSIGVAAVLQGRSSGQGAIRRGME